MGRCTKKSPSLETSAGAEVAGSSGLGGGPSVTFLLRPAPGADRPGLAPGPELELAKRLRVAEVATVTGWITSEDSELLQAQSDSTMTLLYFSRPPASHLPEVPSEDLRRCPAEPCEASGRKDIFTGRSAGRFRFSVFLQDLDGGEGGWRLLSPET